ncbi:MAG: hypothetical protein V2I56_25910 [Desulfobacteraceae bacterium]|jgi:hypothetical protein|nr:hypothetical protein [Desulfobacteraceae bacterium]
MKVLILGTGKTGTTVMVYKVSGGLPNCHAFSGGRPGKYVGDYENAVYKHTYEERKGKSFEIFKEHLNREHYDRKIWMARDPRDAAVSRMLYRWHKGFEGKKKQYEAHLDLVLKKEKVPTSVTFCEICRYTGHNGWPRTVEQVVEEENNRYQQMVKFVKGLGSDWFLLTFEDMVAGKFEALNNYLGFEVQADATVPSASGKAKVIRKKSTGDWRHWFTAEDVEIFKPAFIPYMELIGYDCDDWSPNPNPVIEPEYSSVYMQNLPRKATKNSILRYLDPIVQRLVK